VRNSRVVDHSHDNNVDIQPEHIDVYKVEKGHSGNGVPGRNPDCNKFNLAINKKYLVSIYLILTFLKFLPVRHFVLLGFLVCET
jgi:hypothetical protein